jgi:hypothetical protein
MRFPWLCERPPLLLERHFLTLPDTFCGGAKTEGNTSVGHAGLSLTTRKWFSDLVIRAQAMLWRVPREAKRIGRPAKMSGSKRLRSDPALFHNLIFRKGLWRRGTCQTAVKWRGNLTLSDASQFSVRIYNVSGPDILRFDKRLVRSSVTRRGLAVGRRERLSLSPPGEIPRSSSAPEMQR